MSLISGEDLNPPIASNSNISYLNIGNYVACLYDREWYVAVLDNNSFHDNDIHVKFMHPKGPSKYFKWPEREDQCWVPCEHIIKMLTPPSSNPSGRNFSFNEDEIADVISHYLKLI